MMKAAVFLGPGKIEIREVEKPIANKGEVVIKVEACAICGTDVRTYAFGNKKVNPPWIIGHEIAGTISEIGEGVENLKIGERVTVVTSIGCGKCPLCQKGLYNICPEAKAIGYLYPGGFAEFMKMPADGVKQGNILHIPESLDFISASIIEPLSCCINAQNFLNVKRGDKVVIFGAGPIGAMHLELVKASGVEKTFVVEINEERLKYLKENFDFDEAIDGSKEDPVDKILSLTDGDGVDVVIVAAPSKIAQQQAVRISAIRGRISLFGGLPKDDSMISFDANLVHYREISIFGAFASKKADYEKALDLILSKKIEPERFITHQLPLERIEEGFNLIKEGKALKVVIECSV